MLEALAHLITFLLEAIILVAAILILFSGLVAIASKNKGGEKIKVKKVNEQLEKASSAINEATLNKKCKKQMNKAKKVEQKKAKKQMALKKTLFVLDFDGDVKAKAVDNLREEISAILMTAKKQDEVLLRLESGGGMMHAYGLASSQLKRLKDANIPLTIAIDKVAASGGYMMACIADKIIAAPFSIVGSIGVVAQLPNFYQLLQDKHIDFEQITAGQFKRTMTVFAKNTDEDRTKMQEEIDEAHELFKDFVKAHRPSLDLDKVATGEHWFATKAKEFNLVDELSTSDDFLLQRKDKMLILQISRQTPKKLKQKLAAAAQASFEKAYTFLWKQQNTSHL